MAMKLAKKGGGKGSKAKVTEEEYQEAVEEAKVTRQNGGEFNQGLLFFLPLLWGWKLLMLIICKAEGLIGKILATSP